MRLSCPSSIIRVDSRYYECVSRQVLREWWCQFAACRGLEYDDPGLFFPVHVQGRLDAASVARIDHAKAICAGCVVRPDCAKYAEQAGEVGIWGGEIRHLRPTHPRQAEPTPHL